MSHPVGMATTKNLKSSFLIHSRPTNRSHDHFGFCFSSWGSHLLMSIRNSYSLETLIGNIWLCPYFFPCWKTLYWMCLCIFKVCSFTFVPDYVCFYKMEAILDWNTDCTECTTMMQHFPWLAWVGSRNLTGKVTQSFPNTLFEFPGRSLPAMSEKSPQTKVSSEWR